MRPKDYNAGIIDRPRLVEKLQYACDRRLTVISAPAGYGKTTLAAQFFRQAECPVAWQTIAERERDVPDLHTQSLKALAEIAPGIDVLDSPSTRSPAELVAVVADYLHSTLINDAIYMLDDVHYLAGVPGAEVWLRALITYLPVRCHIVLISRSFPALPLEILTRGQVLILGQNELRLTSQEISRLAVETLGADLPAAELRALETRLEGWPAGTVLALAPQPAEIQRQLWGERTGSEALFEALADLMLKTQPPNIQNFLLVSSVLSRLTPELCTMLGLSHSKETLDNVQARNLFLNPVAGGLAYHTLFRSFLQSQLENSHADEFTRLHTVAARWFEDHLDEDEAFSHYIAAGSTEQAAAIADRVAQSYFVQGKIETLLRWNEELRTIGGYSFKLLYNCAIIYTDRYEYLAAIDLLDDAEQLFTKQKDSLESGNIRVQRAKIDLERGDYLAASAQCQDLLQVFAHASTIRRQALNILGFATLRLGKAHEAIQILEQAVPMYRVEADSHSISQLLQTLSLAYRRAGRLDKARTILQEVVALQRSLGEARSLALALNNLGYHYHLVSDYHQAQVTLQEGLSLVSRFPDRRAETYLLYTLGDLRRDLNDLDGALGLYEKALGLLGEGAPSLHCAILISFATLRRWQQHFDEAALLATEAITLADKHNLGLEANLATAAKWAAQANTENVQLTLAQLDLIDEALAQRSAAVERLRVLAWAIGVAQLGNLPAAVTHYLRSARQVAGDLGSGQPFIAEIQHTMQVLGRFRQDELLSHNLELLRRAQRQQPTALAKTDKVLSLSTYSLRILVLGQEVVMRDGQAVPSSAFHTSNARELFFYLLFNGPSSREKICLMFWPDSPASRVRANFHTTLYRARDAVGEKAIEYDNDLYLINPLLNVSCDVHELEALVQQARPLSPQDARTEELWRRAVELYKGEFLTSMDVDWVLAYRERLHELYTEALMGLGTCALNRSDIPCAIERFIQALRTDPYREDIHRTIMTCYAQQGNRQKILNHLHEMRGLFRKDLKTEPSSETLLFVKNLLSKF